MKQNIVLTVILVLALSLIMGFLLFFRLPVKREKFCSSKGNILKWWSIISIAELSLVLLLDLVVSKLTYAGGIPVSAAVLLPGLSFAAFAAYLSESKLYSLFKRIFIVFAALVLCEVFIFNLKSFTTNKAQETISMDAFQIEGDCENIGETIVIKGDTSLTIDSPPQISHGIVMDLSQERTRESRPFEVSALIKDDNFSTEHQIVQNKFTSSQGRDLTFTISPYGTLRSIRFNFRSITSPVTVNSVTVYTALPFDFSEIRFFVLLIIAVLIICIKEFQLYRTIYDRKNPKHRAIALVMLLLCILSVIPFIHGTESFEYDPEVVHIEDPYVMTFDAFQKGRVSLDIEADPALEELENVYDRVQRDESGADYKWDMAYYNGKYYCYFGVAPVITFYYPYYLLTGKLPNIKMATVFFGFLAVFFFFKMIFAIIRRLVPKANFLMLLILIPAAFSCIGIYYSLNNANTYTLPMISGMCWLFLCLWLGIDSLNMEKMSARLIMLFGSGLALALCAASRPSMALCALILVPFFIGILLDKQTLIKLKLLQASAFIIPVIAGAAAIMMYNIIICKYLK